MHIAVTEPELERFVRDEVAAGRFDSPEQLLRSALTLLRGQDQLANLKAAIAVGIAQADAGELIPWDVADIRREVERRYAAEMASPGSAV